MTLQEAVWQDKDRMSGALCFRNTRVPVAFLFELIAIESIESFIYNYPGVTKEQINTVLEASKNLLIENTPPQQSA